jgi:hypothetical protein
MYELTLDILHQHGIHKSAEEEQAIIAQFNETLEGRVGQTIASLLTEEQFNEVSEIISNDKGGETIAWLEQHMPEYHTIVGDEYNKLLSELSATADKQ